MSIVDHIVVAVDFSEPSRIAVRGALQLAHTGASRQVTILHALRPVVMPNADAEHASVLARLQDLREKINDAAMSQMRTMVGSQAHPFRIEYHVVEGTPARVIPPAARDLGGTLLVTGTHARRGVRRWLRGSVVESMLPQLHMPLLVMAFGEDGIAPETELAQLSHVTLAVDIHDAAGHVVRQAVESLKNLCPQPLTVKLITVVDMETTSLHPDDALLSEVQDMVKSDAGGRLEGLAEQLTAAGMTVTTEVRTGEVEEEILRVAAEKPSQLIVMGTHGEGDVVLDFGSTAAEIIRHSDVGVLVLPTTLRPPTDEAAKPQ